MATLAGLMLAGGFASAADSRTATSAFAAGAGNFTLVNRSGADLSDLQLRRSGGGAWRALGVSVANGATRPISFSDPDCAFDLRGTTAGGDVTWSGVNLCEVNAVILNRRGATPWVDYQ